jgi:hypothetical protein
MPYDPMGSGYGRYSRGKGEYGMQSIYGYGDQGPLYNPQNPNPAPSPPAMTPNAGMTQINPQGDFFSQLAGLMGGSLGQPAQPRRYGDSPYQNVAAGQASIDYAKTLPPAQYWDYMNRNAGRNQQAFGMEKARERGAISQQEAMTRGRVGNGMRSPYPAQQSPGPMGGSVYNPGDDSPNRPVPGQGMPKPGRPMSAPADRPAPQVSGQRAPGLMAGNSPMLGEKNPIGNMPAPRRAPRASGRASAGRNPMGASSFRDPGNNARPGVYY